MKHFKFSAALMLLAALALALGACMNTAEEPQSSAAPGGQSGGQSGSPSVTYMPDSGSGSAGQGADQGLGQGQSAGQNQGSATGSGQGAGAAFDWRANAAQIEGRINEISEVSESRVVVTGSTALVGVKFASAYQGEMTERIREMIAGVVREADPSIQTVAVTAEEGDVDKVYGFADQIQSGQDGDTLAEDINRIVRNITTMR